MSLLIRKSRQAHAELTRSHFHTRQPRKRRLQVRPTADVDHGKAGLVPAFGSFGRSITKNYPRTGHHSFTTMVDSSGEGVPIGYQRTPFFCQSFDKDWSYLVWQDLMSGMFPSKYALNSHINARSPLLACARVHGTRSYNL